jgi:hypothetical protein
MRLKNRKEGESLTENEQRIIKKARQDHQASW